jgi:7-cyano-7-deazaguanine synthase in queuosine biosynthesis
VHTKAVMCFSGGADSLVSWVRMGKPDLLQVELGHKYFRLETLAIEELCQFSSEIRTKLRKEKALFRVGETWEKPDAEIPARNLLIAIAAARLGYDQIGLACQLDERTIPDRSEEFFQDASKMLSNLFSRPITLDPVFPDMDKTSMIQWFLSDTTDKEREFREGLLRRTVACYTPTRRLSMGELGIQEVQCGNCPACFRRAVAFTLNNIEEEYAVDPWSTNVARMYFDKAIKGVYSEQRCQRIISALTKHSKVDTRPRKVETHSGDCNVWCDTTPGDCYETSSVWVD